jgi:hypothetical protein
MHYLSAGLPYSPNPAEHSQLSGVGEDATNPATTFAHAFTEAQLVIARRSRFGEHWPLQEFWGEKLDPYMRIIDSFVEPIIKAAVEKKRLNDGKDLEMNSDRKADKAEIDDEETLLGHLVKYTEGEKLSN